MLLFHQFKYVIRNFIKQKFYSLINIFGLAVAMASIAIISLWIFYEQSFDQSFPKADRIYRFTIERNTPDGYQSHFARTTGNLNLEAHLPEIIKKLRLAPFRYTTVSIGEKKFKSNKIYFTDDAVFTVFDLKLMKGDTSSALSHPNSIIISDKIAGIYFGDKDCIGSVIKILPNHADEPSTYTVTGVFQDLSINSHLHFDLLVSVENFEEYKGWSYDYVLVNEKSNKADLQEKVQQLTNTFFSEEYASYYKLYLQPVTDIHLHSNKDREIEQNGNYQSVILLLAAAIFIFLIALINTINLNITLLFKELKYLKLSKISGANAVDLFSLQLLKSFINNLLGSGIALIFIFLIQRALQNVFWLNSAFLENQSSTIFLIVGSVAFAMMVLSSLPIFMIVLGRIKRKGLLLNDKGLVGLFNPNRKFIFRKSLLIIQFTVSFVLIICAVIIDEQIKLITSNQITTKGSKTVVLNQLSTPVRNEYGYFKQKLMQSAQIKDVTASMESLPNQILDGANFEIIGQGKDEKNKLIYINPVDDNYFKYFELDLVSGEDFPKFVEGQGFDNYIINQAASKYLGFASADEAVGKRFKLIHSMLDFKEGRILGVVNDFHYASLEHKIEPMVYFQRPDFYFAFYIKIDSVGASSGLKKIEEIWQEVYPGHPFEYYFSEQLYQKAYVNEHTQSRLSGSFSLVAIIISFTGLIGLTSIMANRRRKEISIRKVLGASSKNIVLNLSKEYFQMIIIASLLAISASYFLMDKWLQNFAYQIDLIANWWIFLLIFVFLAFFVMSIVTLKAFTASRLNPVESISYE